MPTKFYFQDTRTTELAPAFSVAWSGNTTQASRRLMFAEKGTSIMADGTTLTIAAAANSRALDRQYISLPLSGPQVISGTCSGQLLVREFVGNDNVNKIEFSVRLVNEDGTFFRATGLNVGTYSNISEFSTSMRNKIIASGASATLTNITGQDGDRIVLEIGYATSVGGTTPQAAAKWGEFAGDLPQNESQTVDGAGWFTFNNVDLVFKENPTNVIVT